MMRWSALGTAVLLCVIAPPEAFAQGAGTGGTRDVSAAPTMVFSVRPRDEPAGTTAVPNVPRPQQRVIRLRRAYPVRIRPHR